MQRATVLTLLFLIGATGIPVSVGYAQEGTVRSQALRRSGPVAVQDHGLVDAEGPFLGLGVSYFTALWRFRHDRSRLESDLQFLSDQGFNYYRMLPGPQREFPYLRCVRSNSAQASTQGVESNGNKTV